MDDSCTTLAGLQGSPTPSREQTTKVHEQEHNASSWHNPFKWHLPNQPYHPSKGALLPIRVSSCSPNSPMIDSLPRQRRLWSLPWSSGGVCACMTVRMWHWSTLTPTQTLSDIFQLPLSSTNCWYLPAIIWSKPTGGAFCSWFQFPLHTGGMSALKSLIEIDWVIQLTPSRLGILCAARAFALGDCNKSLSRHRNSTPVLALFIKPNWVEFLSFNLNIYLNIYLYI